ncbi:hypothetical protein IMSAGC020_00632 [Lachnospiraceae bacterium]|jgi:hypothetical protein|nr:hypothetical protein IMSAGC020_00632 [Lachnospiraceae bacterium]
MILLRNGMPDERTGSGQEGAQEPRFLEVME